MDESQTTRILNSENPVAQHTVHTEQPAEFPHPILSPGVQQQLSMGGIAIGTIVCLTLLLREIRLLVEACKS